jgi:hypothetical protein
MAAQHAHPGVPSWCLGDLRPLESFRGRPVLDSHPAGLQELPKQEAQATAHVPVLRRRHLDRVPADAQQAAGTGRGV